MEVEVAVEVEVADAEAGGWSGSTSTRKAYCRHQARVSSRESRKPKKELMALASGEIDDPPRTRQDVFHGMTLHVIDPLPIITGPPRVATICFFKRRQHKAPLTTSLPLPSSSSPWSLRNLDSAVSFFHPINSSCRFPILRRSGLLMEDGTTTTTVSGDSSSLGREGHSTHQQGPPSKKQRTNDNNDNNHGDDGPPPPAQPPPTASKGRKRLTVACDTCRGRRTKCDGVRPQCAYCQANGLRCVYQDPRAQPESQYVIPISPP